MMEARRRPVLLTSLPRSGSTWVLRALEKGRDTFGVFEPDHLDTNRIGRSGMHPYLSLDESWPEYEKLFKSAFKGRRRPDRLASSGGAKILMRNAMRRIGLDRRRVVVKSVFSLHNTLWIAQRFDPVVVVLMRNPYSLIHSVNRKWPDARLGDILAQKHFVDECLSSYKNNIASAATVYEQMGAKVGAYYKAIMDMASHNADWHIVYHEELCKEPLSGFRSLFDALEIEWTLDIEQFLNETNRPKETDNVSDVRRVSHAEVDKWRSLLSNEQIEEIRRYYEMYDGIPYKNM